MAKKDGLNGWLQRVRKTGEYSDVVVRVNGEEFHLHMLPLQNGSGYFRNLPSSSNGGTQVHEPSGCKLVTIHDLPGGVEGFAIAADMCYLLKSSFTVHNVALVHATGEFLHMDEITETTKRFMQAHIFSHWRHCTGFLQHYQSTGAPVDEYIEFRSHKVIATACVKAFTDTKHVSAPSAYISGPLTPAGPLKAQASTTSACQSLTDLLVAVCSLPDRQAAEIINTLVESDVNLSLKCRQGRGVRSWLESVIEDECGTDRARCWVILCLSRMLLKNAPAQRPWMELSSQYWCCLLEQADLLLPLLDDPPLTTDCSSGDADLDGQSQSYIKERLMGVKSILEEKIGESLDEMDEYLRDYKFSPETLLSLVDSYVSLGDAAHTSQSLEEIAGDVDRFLYFYAGEGSISPDSFLTLFRVFPSASRSSHDTVYGAIEKLLSTFPDCSHAEQQQLWSLIDHCKLSPALNERALNNPVFLSQPEILESVLQHHSQELANVDDGDDGRHLRHIMQKVINASLKLLEENSRRSREILELQKQYGELLGCRSQMLDHEGIVDLLRRHSVDSGHGNPRATSLLLTSDETEESEVSDSATSSTGGNSRLAMLPWRCSVREEV